VSLARVVVIGSSNTDMVVKCASIPKPGETTLGGEFAMFPGGKGANQAVCASRLGAEVVFVARVGNDVFGERAIAGFEEAGVDTSFVVKDPVHPSGVALIVVDEHGENAIVVAPGANGALMPDDVDRASEAIANADVVVTQLEIPVETVAHAVKLARQFGTKVVLNPAPIRPLTRELLADVSVLVPNQHEAAGLLGKTEFEKMDPSEAASELLALGVDGLVMTLGSRGAIVADANSIKEVPALKVDVVDTTAAGDAFTAALSCGLAEGKTLVEAAQFASRVAAISVTRLGAQPSMPRLDEVESFFFGN